MATRKVVLPAPWKRFVQLPAGTTCLEHPELDVRAEESLLGLAVAALSRGESVGLFLGDVVRARGVLAEMLSRLSLRAKYVPSPGATCMTLGRSTLFVAGARSLSGELRLPRCDLLLASGCHELPRNPLLAVGTPAPRRSLLAGELADRGHWFIPLGRADGTVLERMPLPEVLARWPELAAKVPARGDRRLRRKFLLEDVIEPTPPLVVFARKRLIVRTAKGAEFLSSEQMERIHREHGAAWNPSDSSPPLVPFELTRMQRRYLALKQLGRRRGFRRFMLLKYRRGGFTTLEQGSQYRIAVTRPGTQTATLSFDADQTSRVFGITHTFLEHDPESPKTLRVSSEHIGFRNGSSMIVGTAGGRGFGRGDAFQIVHGSEVSKWCQGPRQRARVEDLMAGVMIAAQHGEVTLETTADGVDWFASTYREAKQGRNGWWPIFLAWFSDRGNTLLEGAYDPDEIRDTLSAEEKGMIERHGLTLAQVAWRRKEQRNLGRLFKQEWPEDDETCFLSSGSCYFDVERVSGLLQTVKEVGRTHVAGGYETRWKQPQPGHKYVIGADTSEGLPGCDPNGLGILDKATGEQVAAMHGLFNPTRLAEHLVRLSNAYNGALIAVERNNHGHAVLLHLRALGVGRSHLQGGRLFFHVTSSEEAAKAGWLTNEGTRAVMLEALARAVETGDMVVRDRDFLGECLSFRLQPRSGKFEADPGQHDDGVMKWAIAWQMLKQRKRRPRIVLVGEETNGEA